MRSFICLVIVAVMPSLAIGQEMVRIGNGMFVLVGKSKQQIFPVTDYELAMRRAITEGKPLVTFVGCPQRVITSAIVCSVDKLAGVPSPAIIIGVPSLDRKRLDRKRLDWIDTLPANATDAEITATWQLTEPTRPKAVQPMASSFRYQQATVCRT